MYYLSWAMYPLCVGGAIYALIYTPHTRFAYTIYIPLHPLHTPKPLLHPIHPYTPLHLPYTPYKPYTPRYHLHTLTQTLHPYTSLKPPLHTPTPPYISLQSLHPYTSLTSLHLFYTIPLSLHLTIPPYLHITIYLYLQVTTHSLSLHLTLFI